MFLEILRGESEHITYRGSTPCQLSGLDVMMQNEGQQYSRQNSQLVFYSYNKNTINTYQYAYKSYRASICNKDVSRIYINIYIYIYRDTYIYKQCRYTGFLPINKYGYLLLPIMADRQLWPK